MGQFSQVDPLTYLRDWEKGKEKKNQFADLPALYLSVCFSPQAEVKRAIIATD